MYYTIGQRKGLGIGGPGAAHGLLWVKIMIKIFYIFVRGDQKDWLYSSGALISDVNWIATNNKPIDKISCNAKFRYRQKDNPIQLEFVDENTVYLTF